MHDHHASEWRVYVLPDLANLNGDAQNEGIAIAGSKEAGTVNTNETTAEPHTIKHVKHSSKHQRSNYSKNNSAGPPEGNWKSTKKKPKESRLWG